MKGKKVLIFTIIFLLVIGIDAAIYFLWIKKGSNTNVVYTSEMVTKEFTNKASIKKTGITLRDLDLTLLKNHNDKENTIYSPLSIKYGLGMLYEGTAGDSKEQLAKYIDDTKLNRYLNSSNLSIANALFTKDSYKDSIKNSYIKKLKDEYNADIVYGTNDPETINKWVKEKSLNLIDNLVDDSIKDEDFLLINTVAIDMEWVNKIQSMDNEYEVILAHRNYSQYISPLPLGGYYDLSFEGKSEASESVEIAATINRYDVIKTVGEENIRKTVTKKYQEWLDNGAEYGCYEEGKNPSAEEYIEQYLEEIGSGYNKAYKSTDFYLYDSEDVKAFAKDLKEYNGTTLQYVGIMPKNEALDSFINNIKVSDLNKIIENLKDISLDNFEDGYVTDIRGYIPTFAFDYKLDLISDLQKLGITDIFDSSKANLSKLTKGSAVIDKVEHQANIDFSNDGIKATAAITVGGAGAGDCGFEYIYEIPVKKIDLTFDKPYLFIIREKLTGEVWFVGSVYNPNDSQGFGNGRT